ncbi:MAG: PilZ domain-containing protein [Brevundimonas sp.]|uniref:PilZ domain-containing protein n=1 Tax=Brevundimonas sp. TaxID=1871086 RepID=UPI002ABA3175|nr:PilZ domain-containing protein [Brevundimonas sp.]MDZ4113044.1 PilZ domain-containing protein [Brevundimonas sp.]
MSTGSNPSQPDADRRSTQRDRCVLRCRITHGPWNEVLDAIIRDLHEDGARLRLSAPVVMAGRMRLEIQPSGAVHMADVAWQRGDEIGVRLIATLDETVERQIEALRRAGAQTRQSRRGPTNDDGY